jgi:hypothetical protein
MSRLPVNERRTAHRWDLHRYFAGIAGTACEIIEYRILVPQSDATAAGNGMFDEIFTRLINLRANLHFAHF